MRKLIFAVSVVLAFSLPAAAAEIVPPEVPKSGAAIMPEGTESFGDGLGELVGNALEEIRPDLEDAVGTGKKILLSSLLFSILPVLSGKTEKAVTVASAAAITALVLQNTGTLILLASETVTEICEYGKLLCPVMTAALAAQGAVSSSTALYAGTTFFTAVLGTLISRIFVPMVYGFLAFSTANGALEEGCLKRFAESIKSVLSWMLKTMMILFTGYMSITGVVTGTADAAALKAAKLTISSAVPVVGGILSDASETILVSMGLMKNAAGIYGILAALAVFLGPFLKVGLQYLVLKATAALCGIFAAKNIAGLVNDLSSAMGLLLGMLAAACAMVLISTVCFLKGAG